jgi:hypothetical protein
MFKLDVVVEDIIDLELGGLESSSSSSSSSYSLSSDTKVKEI